MLLASVLAFVSALTFAANSALVRKGVETGTLLQAMAVTVPSGALLGWFGLGILGALPAAFAFAPAAYLYFVVAGILHFVFGRYCHYRALKAMGANLVGPVQQLSIVVSLVLAVLLLGESPAPLQMAGIATILVCPVLLLDRRPASPGLAAPRFVPDRRQGYIYAFISAMAFGISPILISHGLSETADLTAGLAGGTLAYSAAAAIVVVCVLALRGSQPVWPMPGNTFYWYGIAGLLVGISQLAGYMALALAPVAVVVPIQRTAIVLRLGFSRLLNRDSEVFGGRMVLASCLSLAGAVAVAVDPGMWS